MNLRHVLSVHTQNFIQFYCIQIRCYWIKTCNILYYCAYCKKKHGFYSKFLHFVHRIYRGVDKSLARPGRKQARKHGRDARDFNNIETRAVIKFFFSCKARPRRNSHHSDRNISLFPSLAG